MAFEALIDAIDPQADDTIAPFFLLRQHGCFGGLQDAVQTPENRERQNHLAVTRIACNRL